MLTRIRKAIRTLTDRESARWLPTPAGCCNCGTGGPYYEGDAPQVTRYVYGDACADSFDTTPDWSSCSAHPLDYCSSPVVDYGSDVIRTFAQIQADYTRKLADRAAGWICPMVDCHPAPGRPRMHTHSTPKAR